MRGLTGKVAIVTGALGDLGYASAQRLAEEGVATAIFDIKPDDDRRAEKIGAHYFQVDTTNEPQIEKACQAVKQKLGPVNVLVNCAARFIFKGIDATPEDWQQITAVNLTGASLMAKHVVPQMRDAGSGSIINFSSISGFVGQANFATYNATKFGIRGLTACWAQDLAPDNIRVNSLCPGYIYTSAFVDSCKSLELDEQQEYARAAAMHLAGRLGKPEEVAAGVAFLASEDATFMTGSDLVIDGGYLAK